MQTNEPVSDLNQQASGTQPANSPPATETAASHQPIVSKKTPKWLMAGLAIFLLVTTGVFAFKYYQLKQQLDETQPTPPSKITTTSPSPVLSPSPITDSTADWKTYTIEELNLEFKLPKQLSNFQTWKTEVLFSEKGKNICFKYLEKQSLIIKPVHAGGIGACLGNIFTIASTSIDFEAGRGGLFTDLQGYEKRDSKYYFKLPGNKTGEIPSELITTVVNPYNIEIITIQGKNYGPDSEAQGLPISGTPGEGKIGALIDTSNPNHPGIAVQLELDKGITIKEFNQILSTFKFIN